MSYRFLHYACLCLASIALVGWLAWFWMWQVAPHAPDGTHVIAENNHGSIIYFTRFEATWGPACWIVGACSAIAGNIFKKRSQVFPKSKFFP